MKNKANIIKRIQEELDYREILSCMRCGLCQSHCPTFKVFKRTEANSPRGRLGLMRGLKEGIIEPDEGVRRYFDDCVTCRKCEEVCPSGVNYISLINKTRDIFDENK